MYDAILAQYFVSFSIADINSCGTLANFNERSTNHSCVTESKAFW